MGERAGKDKDKNLPGITLQKNSSCNAAEPVLNSPEEPVVSGVLLHAAVGTETQVQADASCRPREIKVPRVQHFAHFRNTILVRGVNSQ